MEIELGDKVKCKITGFIGVAVARTEFINKCVQYVVAGKVSKDGKYPEEVNIDEQSLQVIGKKSKPKKEKGNGGPTTIGKKMKGF